MFCRCIIKQPAIERSFYFRTLDRRIIIGTEPGLLPGFRSKHDSIEQNGSFVGKVVLMSAKPETVSGEE